MAAPNKGPHGPFHMDQRMGIIALLLSTTGMGLAGCLTRGATRVDFFGTEYVAGESIGAWMTLGRMVCGLLTFIVLVCVTRRAGVLRRTQVSPSIILGGLCIGIALSLYMVSALLTTDTIPAVNSIPQNTSAKHAHWEGLIRSLRMRRESNVQNRGPV